MQVKRAKNRKQNEVQRIEREEKRRQQLMLEEDERRQQLERSLFSNSLISFIPESRLDEFVDSLQATNRIGEGIVDLNEGEFDFVRISLDSTNKVLIEVNQIKSNQTKILLISSDHVTPTIAGGIMDFKEHEALWYGPNTHEISLGFTMKKNAELYLIFGNQECILDCEVKYRIFVTS
jgi:hypothetical protein